MDNMNQTGNDNSIKSPGINVVVAGGSSGASATVTGTSRATGGATVHSDGIITGGAKVVGERTMQLIADEATQYAARTEPCQQPQNSQWGGMMQSGVTQPGMMQPGMTQPGVMQPDMTHFDLWQQAVPEQSVMASCEKKPGSDESPKKFSSIITILVVLAVAGLCVALAIIL